MKPKFFIVCYISFLAILFLANTQIAFGQNFLVTEDLRLDWVFYDENEKVMLPFLDNSNEYPISIHLTIDLDKGKEAYLMLDIPEHTSLFFENKFIKHHDENILRYYSLDSLRNGFEMDKLQLTLYNKENFGNPLDAKIGFIYKTFKSEVNINLIKERYLDKRSDYLKIIILVLFAFFVVLYTLYPTELLDFLSLSTVVTFRYTNTAITKYRSMARAQTLVILYEALLLAGILIIFLNYYYNPFGKVFFLEINPLFGWLFIYGIVLLLLFLKFILIGIVSALFGLTGLINFYFVEYLRMTMIFYSIMFVILSFTIINNFHVIEVLLDVLIISVIFFNFIRLLILYFKFRRVLTLKSLHLFSYLCTTELIPIIIGLKFFLK